MLNAINKNIFRLMAVLLAVTVVFFGTVPVFAMESTEENSGISEEESKSIGGSCGAGLSWNFAGGTLAISGSGAMTDFSGSGNAPWSGFCEEINTITFSEGITSIGNFSFYDCINVTAVVIPNSVKTIGKFAFGNCKGMKILNLGTGVEIIGEEAFSNCRSITALNFPDSLKTIGFKAFYRCESITTVTIPSGVNSLGVSAFGYCKNLVSATIHAQISVLPEFVFYNCEKLTVVNLPESISEVGEDSFEGCDSLSTVYYNGENVSSEDLEEKIGGGVSVESGSSSGNVSGGFFTENEDGSLSSENTTVTEKENSTVSATTETILSPEGEVVEKSETEVTIDIRGESGWEEAAGAVEDIFKNYGTADDGSEKHINFNLFVQGTDGISQEFIESIAGKDVTVTITTENGSVWIINGKDIDTAQLSGNYSLAYILEAGTSELCEKLGAGTSFVLKFLAPAEINAEVLIKIGGNYARQSASLFQDGKEIAKVQSVVVDNEGYAHFYLGSVSEKTEYYIGINVPGAAEEAIIPQNMLAEYGNPEYIEPIKYEITGRTSSWGMNLGQVMSILAVVMVSVIIVVGAVMFFWNRQRLKNGYVPDLDEEET